MILQALVSYYDRKVAIDSTALAPEGFVPQAIPFLLVVDSNGRFLHIEDTREPVGKKLIARTFVAPAGPKKSSGVASNLLWERIDYALGVSSKTSGAKLAQRHTAFIQAIVERFGDNPLDPGVHAVLQLARNFEESQASGDPLWGELKDSEPVVSFLLAGDSTPVFSRSAVRDALSGTAAGPGRLCLVTGTQGPVARLHPALKGIPGAQTSGASLVSFNLQAAESLGLEQGNLAPVGELAASKYGKALNALLGRNSRQKIRLGADGATTIVVFWAAEASGAPFESAFLNWFEAPKDNPDAGTDRVRTMLAFQQGKPFTDDDDQQFYVVGLSPNAARVSIRFVQVGSIREIGTRALRFFTGLAIDHPDWAPSTPSLWQLLSSISAQGEAKNLPPSLSGDWMRSILAGLPYPATLLSAAVRRNRAEQDVPYLRAALIKAFLLSHDLEEGLTVALNRDNPHASYQLGRLFAVLEQIQEEASPGVKATIRDRFYGAASSTPVSVFPILMRTKNHHLSKIGGDRPGRATNLEKLVGGIVDRLDGEAPFPTTLPLADQGRFAVGYYQQKQHPSTYKAEE